MGKCLPWKSFIVCFRTSSLLDREEGGREGIGILGMSGFSYFIPGGGIVQVLARSRSFEGLFVCWQTVDIVTRISRRFGRGLAEEARFP